ncbi:MAG TPA: OmpH family outer membrane protein [Bacteroidetes bacterium]|nr:OmpH family outer membrane protein [Bacteroidota bacterium]
MKKLLNTSVLLSLLLVAASNAGAQEPQENQPGTQATEKPQKIGYLNSMLILSNMPGVKESDEALKVYQDSLVAIGEQKAAALQKDVEAFMTEYNAGNVPPIKAREKQAEFQQREQELLQYEQVILSLVNERREKLLQPYIEKLQKAIDEVGKEGGYTILFETGPANTGFSALLYAPESDDISEKVKAKLGMQ